MQLAQLAAPGGRWLCECVIDAEWLGATGCTGSASSGTWVRFAREIDRIVMVATGMRIALPKYGIADMQHQQMQDSHERRLTGIGRLAALVVFGCTVYAVHSGTAEARELPSLESMLERIREHELLYSDIEVTYVRVPRTVLPEEEMRGTTYVIGGQTRDHVVIQGPLYYLKREHDLEHADGSRLQTVVEVGFDGQVTRTNEQGEFGNIAYERVPPISFFAPHKFGFSEVSEHSLADFIAFSPAVAEDPQYDTLNIKSRIVEETEWDGINCLLVECADYGREGSETPLGRHMLWIAPKRNYLPIRCVRYWHAFSDELPFAIYQTRDWRELVAGVWIPYECHADDSRDDYLQRGLIKQVSHVEWRVENVRLDPDYGAEFFKNIQMPHGKVVYVLRGGEVVDQYIEGAAERFISFKPGRRFWLIVANLLVLILFAVWWSCWFRRRQRLGSDADPEN